MTNESTRADLGPVPVDSGQLLICDPCNLPPELVRALTSPNAYGVTVAVVTPTQHGDGAYDVEVHSDGVTIWDPYA